MDLHTENFSNQGGKTGGRVNALPQDLKDKGGTFFINRCSGKYLTAYQAPALLFITSSSSRTIVPLLRHDSTKKLCLPLPQSWKTLFHPFGAICHTSRLACLHSENRVRDRRNSPKCMRNTGSSQMPRKLPFSRTNLVSYKKQLISWRQPCLLWQS